MNTIAMVKFFTVLYCGLMCFFTIHAQEAEKPTTLKSQVSINVPYLALGSLNMSYEYVLGNHFAIGLGGVSYGKNHQKQNLEPHGTYDYSTTYEITPFGRWYMNGTQRKSHFLELFGSINESKETDRYVRSNNEEGYGVYNKGILNTNHIGLGAGYGYRFLLAKNKLILEAQIGLRTNFTVQYFFLDVAVVRTGIRIGYRF